MDNTVEGPTEGSWWDRTVSRLGKAWQKTKDVNSTTPLQAIPESAADTSLRDRGDAVVSSTTTAGDGTGSKITITKGEGSPDVVDLTSIQWRDNPLSRYRNYTYNITWSACRDLPDIPDYPTYMSNRNANDEEGRFAIIAQSGSTKYNITSLTIESFVGPGPNTRNSYVTNIVMEITEPYGMSLLDTLKNTAEVLGNVNYGKTYYFLEVRFNSYDENGVIVSTDVGGVGFTDDEVNSGRKQYGFYLMKVTPLSIEPTITESGASYRIIFRPLAELAFSDYNYRLQAPLKCSGKTTEQALMSLADKLNEEVRIRNLGRQVLRYQFVIEDPDLKKYLMKTDDPFKTHDADVNNTGDPEHQSSTGLTIGDLIDAIYLNSTLTDFWKEKLEDPESGSDKLKTIIRVYPEVRYLEYDYVNDDYIREITYHIHAYSTLRPIVSSEGFKSDMAKSSELIDKLATGNLIKKRYDYIFTGKNTEVMNFDIRFNLNWGAVVNAFNGARRGYAAAAEAPLHNEQMAEQIYNLDAQLQSSANIIETFLSQNGDGVVMDSSGAKTDLRAEADRLAATRRELYDLNAANTGGNRAGYEEKLAILTDLTRDIVERANVLEAQRRKTVFDALGRNDAGEKRFRRFAEDIQTRNNRDIVMPITVRRSSEDFSSRYGAGSMGDWNIGKSVMGAVLNQVYGPMEKDLQKISLDVRGDPYWFGGSNMDSGTVGGGKSTADFPLFQYGDHCIYVTFQYPIAIDPLTQEMTLSGSESFNGIYCVNKITHHMVNGVFKQTLEASRLPVITVSKPQTSVVSPTSQSTDTAPTLPSDAPIAPEAVRNTSLSDSIIRKRNEEAEVDTQLSTLRAENYQLIDKISMASATGDTALANSLRQQQAIVGKQIRDLDQEAERLANERSELLKQVR